MNRRPSHGEITGKIKAAKAAQAKANVKIVDLKALISDADELGYTVNELQEVLSSLLEEASPDNYAGTRPPQKSYVEMIKGVDLFAFRISSNWFGQRVYLKFAVVNDTLWLVSLHKNR